MEQSQKDSLKVQVFRQRISELVVQYEEQLAEFRAEATVAMDDLHRQVQSLQEELAAEREKNAVEDTPQDEE